MHLPPRRGIVSVYTEGASQEQRWVTMGDDMTRAEFAQYLKDFEDRIKLQFADLRRESHQLRALLESRLTHVSQRVDRIDRR